MSRFDPLIYAEDDGLNTPEIGQWALLKYKLLGAYCDIFTMGMRNKWEQLVYVDLFAGAGHARLKESRQIVKTSALIAASIPHPFTHYILCEENPDCFSSLEVRFKKDHPVLNSKFISGDSNKNIEEIIESIPKSTNALRFCFVDPFSLNLEFETIRRLSTVGRIDFLILLALQMDGKRNFHNYISEQSTKVDRFISDSTWRKPFQNQELPEKHFTRYLADRYDKNMQTLGYVVDPDLKYEVKVDNRLSLYYLAFYSKNKVGNDFYKKIERYNHVQQKLF